jgi:lyso-ornithine lipid O-acyltransferase
LLPSFLLPTPLPPTAHSNPQARAYRLLYRIPLVFVYVVGALISLASLGLIRASLARRTASLHRWCAGILARLNVRVTVAGTPPAAGIIVSNHLSYLDIFLASAAVPCVFVSKKEVRSYPLIGQAAALTGTIFIDRDRSARLQSIGAELEDTLRAGIPVCFFPEGTTSNGASVLRFHAALFAPAVRLHVPITATGITYSLPEGGDPAELVAYWGDMKMLPHIFRFLTLPRINATIRFAPESYLGDHGEPLAAARAAANRAHTIVEGLRQPLTADDANARE